MLKKPHLIHWSKWRNIWKHQMGAIMFHSDVVITLCNYRRQPFILLMFLVSAQDSSIWRMSHRRGRGVQLKKVQGWKQQAGWEHALTNKNQQQNNMEETIITAGTTQQLISGTFVSMVTGCFSCHTIGLTSVHVSQPLTLTRPETHCWSDSSRRPAH